jgi:aminopeptidase N
MRTEHNPKTIRLKDYQAPSFWILKTELDICIEAESTRISSTLSMRRNLAMPRAEQLILDAGALLTIESIEIDGVRVDQFSREGEQLIMPAPPADHFVLRTQVRLDPAQNTTLEGLYRSGGLYCTQCEAEGFRQITPYLDRPDVLSVFTTRIESDMSLPTLLANGNQVSAQPVGEARHCALWHDPFPKPSYLFAMVAGDLVCTKQTFQTQSGRAVTLQLYAEVHNQHKTHFALASLQRAMRWDEQTYGREYDLDLYMIVAVDHFNMGAMENKGLNIFNSACVLADEASTTDRGFESIESIVAHEYFHNWSGNRVTCRDWFQLSLKEGFTVFRDSQFTADMHHAAVKRIDDVQLLINQQFTEDAGPMAHPVRPAEYIEINNFYTLTVYEKGAEVVRMLHTLLGPTAFRAGTDLYIASHDGSAATVEDFVACMAEVSGLDLTQFKHWYHQAGTPEVDIKVDYDAALQQLKLHFTQRSSSFVGSPDDQPFHIPVRLGLLQARDGAPIPVHTNHPNYDAEHAVFSLRAAEETLICEQVNEAAVPSLFRDFSAPVRYTSGASAADLELLARHDENQFNRWFAWQNLATQALLSLIQQKADANERLTQLTQTLRHLMADTRLEPAIQARLLTLPSYETLANASAPIDPVAVSSARQLAQTTIAQALLESWRDLFLQTEAKTPYQFQAKAAGQRALHLTALDYLMWGDNQGWRSAEHLYVRADNMTERNGALLSWAQRPNAAWYKAMDGFYAQWSGDAQVVERWLSMMATSPAMTAADIQKLYDHEAFSWHNPNRVRSVVGGFCMRNPTGFFASDGSGFDLLLDAIIRLNSSNPQIAARLCTPFTQWQRYVPSIRSELFTRLETLAERSDLSAGVYEMVSKSIQAAASEA